MSDEQLLNDIRSELAPDVAPSLLFFDLENFAMLVEVWEAYEANALRILRPDTLAAVAYAWGDEDPQCRILPDYEAAYRRSRFDDSRLARFLWGLMDDADIVIAHNGDRFDLRKAHAYFARHELGAPSHYRSIDTLKVARRHMKFPRNGLGELGRELGLGNKVPTGGYGLWVKCMEGDPEAWKLMREYAIQDVALLRSVYERLAPYQTTVNFGLYDPCGAARCRSCGSQDLEPSSSYKTKVAAYPAYRCRLCGTISRERKQANNRERPELT